MTNGEIIEVAASEGASASPCWPLPPEWDKAIPPKPTKIVEYHGPLGFSGAGPAWNGQWLLGLEKYVRSIVRDELSKANPGADRTRHLVTGTVEPFVGQSELTKQGQ